MLLNATSVLITCMPTCYNNKLFLINTLSLVRHLSYLAKEKVSIDLLVQPVVHNPTGIINRLYINSDKKVWQK